ncbi:MAG TPA: methylamine utilization protein [Candidatus Margulisiibacteriota bacterium]|nr:methylamine utilization protein [Candidatus Margulisiibacteriota bacterium]
MSALRFMGAGTIVVVALFGVGSPLRAAEISGRVIDPQGNPVRAAVVFIDQPAAGAARPVKEPTATMDQVHRQFVPHILPVEVGTLVSFPNHDQIHHHVYSLSRTKTFEIPLYKGETAPPIRFDQVGAVKLGCNIHDWMSGVILVVPTPYFATTDEHGAFTLRGVPPGTYGVVAWHEGSKVTVEETRQSVTAGAGASLLTFTLEVVEPRVRPVARRGYE